MSAYPATVSAPVPVATLYVRLVAVLAARVAACSDCAALPAGKFCLSHVCLDCGCMAHPHGLVCRRTACFSHPGCDGR